MSLVRSKNKKNPKNVIQQTSYAASLAILHAITCPRHFRLTDAARHPSPISTSPHSSGLSPPWRLLFHLLLPLRRPLQLPAQVRRSVVAGAGREGHLPAGRRRLRRLRRAPVRLRPHRAPPRLLHDAACATAQGRTWTVVARGRTRPAAGSAPRQWADAAREEGDG